jgi:hypothetical protein
MAILLVVVATLIRLTRAQGSGATTPSVGLLGITTLLVAPGIASYHLTLLWLPVGLLSDFFLRARALGYGYLLLGSYALTGFFPYRLIARFDARGGLTVLAYPRLILLLVMFLVSVLGLWGRAGKRVRSDASPTHRAAITHHDGP